MTAVGRVLLGLGLLLGALLVGGCGGDGTSTDAAIPEECLREEGRCVVVGIGEPLYLGALLSLDRDSGRDALASVRLAVDYLDGVFDGIDGQLLGHRIALVEEDDGCSAAAGRTGALRLLEEPHLLGVIGTTCSSAALGAAARVLGDAGVTMVSPSATAPALTDPEREDRTFFRTVFNDRLQAAVVAEFAVSEQRWERPLAIALEQDAYSEQLAGAFVANAGRLGADADILTVPADIGANALLVAIRRTDPDVLFLPIPDPTCTTLADRIRAAPTGRSLPMIVGEACQSVGFLETLGARANGVYASGPDFSYIGDSAFYTREVREAYRRQEGVEPRGPFHVTGFDAANLLLGAIRRTAVRLPGGALVIDRERLRSAMLDIDGYPGLSGSLTCTPSGDCAQGARIAIYRAPAWPAVEGAAARPVFSQVRTLAQLGLTG